MNSSFRSTPPAPTEHAAYYQAYVGLVPAGDIVETLAKQQAEMAKLFSGLTEEQGNFSYAPGKWNVKELLGHVMDAERIFGFRALWFARGGQGVLASMEQDNFVAYARHGERPLAELIKEFDHVRSSTIDLYLGFDEAAWLRHGVAANNDVSVRALAWITAGHAQHHLGIVRERYLPAM